MRPLELRNRSPLPCRPLSVGVPGGALPANGDEVLIAGPLNGDFFRRAKTRPEGVASRGADRSFEAAS